jgi:hypothetical protein
VKIDKYTILKITLRPSPEWGRVWEGAEKKPVGTHHRHAPMAWEGAKHPCGSFFGRGQKEIPAVSTKYSG